MRDIFIVFKPGAKNCENIKPKKMTRKEKIDNSNPKEKENPKESLVLTRQLIFLG